MAPALALLALVAVFTSFAQAVIKIDPSTREFVDEFSRTRVFHGVNAVYKIPPWHPQVDGFDPSNSLSAEDAVTLKRWGFNVVRLGVMWPGVEPGVRGQYNATYLDQIETIVTNLAKQDIFVILDFHQDLWHRKFCGEGVPDYVYELCIASEPAGTAPFPQPAVNGSYPLDSNGDPTLEACLSRMFATYYLSAEVGAGFQCLYDNRHGLWDALAGYWVAVAQRFAAFPSVLGYELINEPWAGDVFASPRNLLPQYAEKAFLQPLYQHLHTAIREVDAEKILFFEGLTIDYWASGFTAGPGGAAFNDRQALAYHVYCPASNASSAVILACNALDNYFFAHRASDAQRLGTAMLMTEFGAAEDVRGDLSVLEAVAAQADRYKQSWMYWQFKYFQDITTCTPQGESLYGEDGQPVPHKLAILSRTYPQAVAGALASYEYSVHNGDFKMDYAPMSAPEGVPQQPTVIFVNRAQTYPLGLSVKLSSEDSSADPSGSFEVRCPTATSSEVHIQQLAHWASNLQVSISACRSPLRGDCSCR